MKPYKPLPSKKMSFVEDLIENLPIGLMILDRDGKVLRMNRKQEETSRIPREKILGKTFAEAFPKTLEQGLKKHYTNLLKKGIPFNFVIDRYIPQYNAEQMTYRARGARFSSGRHFILINELEKELYYEKRLVEARTDELHVSEKFLKSMEERLFLTEKLALYSELMGGIAHQLNNPLIGVVNFSEMLLRQMEEEDTRKEMARTIHRAGKECLKIITSVLNCFKDPHLTFTQTDIHDVLRDSISTLKEQFGEKLSAVSINEKFDTNVPLIIGDSVQLKQSFLNILTNAVQAMLPKGGQLRLGTALSKKENELRIFISDTGQGIPKESLNKVFLPFFTVGNNPGRHGLGLSFAYQIIKNHDGQLKVKSNAGAGTVFTVVLPLRSET